MKRHTLNRAMPIARAYALTSALAMTVTGGLILTSLPAAAGPDGKSGKRRGPPSMAFDVCAEQEAGAACSFEGRRGDVEGTCIIPDGRDALVCAPPGGPRWKRAREQEPEQE